MTSAQVVDLVNRIERDVPTADWRLGGLRAWPLARIRFYNRELRRAGIVDDVPIATGQSGGGPIRRMFGGRRACRRARRADAAGELGSLSATDIVLLSDGVSFANLGGLWYDRFCDPVVERAQARGLTAAMFAPLHTYLVPRHTPSRFVQPAIDVCTARALISHKLRGVLPGELPGYREAVAIADEVGAGGSMPTPADLSLLVRRVNAVRDFYGRALDRLQPRLAFVVSYYALDQMAFVLACRDRGVPVADLQHGAMGDWHVAYGRWINLPGDGFALLPTHFWVWTETDAASIRRWQPDGLRHAPVVGGNPFLQAWKGDLHDAMATIDERIGRLRASGGGPTVLVTLSWGMDPADIRLLGEVIVRSPASWSWWVRLHPSAAHERDGVLENLGAAAAARVELDEVSGFPLYALLRRASVHLTHSSSVVLEAREFGVRSVVWSAFGAELCRHEVDTGWALLATTVDGIVDALGRQAGVGERSPAAGATVNDADAALDRLLELSGDR